MDEGMWQAVRDEITRDWLDVFAESKAKGEDLADSVFWRLAMFALPEGVDPENAEVQSALREIKAAVERRG